MTFNATSFQLPIRNSVIIIIFLLLTTSIKSQVPAVDSMGASMWKKDWKAALHWALKAGQDFPPDKNWRYMNAAIFASLDHDADLAFKYLNYVSDSEIAIKVSYTDKDFDWLHEDSRWKALMGKVNKLYDREKQKRIAESKPFRVVQQNLLDANTKELAALQKTPSATAIYNYLKATKHKGTSMSEGSYRYHWLKFNDSLEVTYTIQLPPGFDYHKRYPVIVILHGAVLMNPIFPDILDSTKIDFFGRKFIKTASDFGMIAIFPTSTRKYNWMVPDSGFTIVTDIIREVKRMYNIDDSRVYVSGHSNGATGAFSYLIKAPSIFAGFSGLNNNPKVRTGGTFLKNAINRSFYNVATENDYYFPFEAHRTLQGLSKKLSIDWKNMEVNGNREHSYLIVADDSITNRVYKDLFAFVLAKKRNPFRSNLYWECDDIKYGRCDWLETTILDTNAVTAPWHTQINFKVSGWRDSYDPSIVKDSTTQAFQFPRRSGAIKASYKNNTFSLQTSRVKKAKIFISPEMVDMSKPIKIIANGKVLHNKKVYFNKNFTLEDFGKHQDHQAIWVNYILLNIPK